MYEAALAMRDGTRLKLGGPHRGKDAQARQIHCVIFGLGNPSYRCENAKLPQLEHRQVRMNGDESSKNSTKPASRRVVGGNANARAAWRCNGLNRWSALVQKKP